MDYILTSELTSDDIDFLNITTIEFELHNPTISNLVDSGWCDYATGARIVTKEDRAIFKEPSEQQLTFLQMKYGEQLKAL